MNYESESFPRNQLYTVWKDLSAKPTIHIRLMSKYEWIYGGFSKKEQIREDTYMKQSEIDFA